jgi:hypothetical protein
MMKKRRSIKCESEMMKERRQVKINHERRGEETGRRNEVVGRRDN